MISQVLAIPPRRRERAIVSYLTPAEIDALLAAPDRATWHGRRDHALLLLAVQTGLRVSELTGLTVQRRRTWAPGRTSAATARAAKTGQPRSPARPSRRCRTWLAELGPDPDGPLFPDPGRKPALPRRRRDARRQARQPQPRQLPVHQGEERHPAHAPALRRHVAAARRRRHLGHRPLARPRGHRKPPRSTFTPT